MLLSFICWGWGRARLWRHFLLSRSGLNQLDIVILALCSSIVSLGILLGMLSGCLINWLKLSSRCLLRHSSASHRSVPGRGLSALGPRAPTGRLRIIPSAFCLLGPLLSGWGLIFRRGCGALNRGRFLAISCLLARLSCWCLICSSTLGR